MANIRADRLRKARKAAGFRSASEAARSLGVSPSTYIHHENGTRDFDETAATLYARRYHVDLAWLMLGKGPTDPRSTTEKRHADMLTPLGPACSSIDCWICRLCHQLQRTGVNPRVEGGRKAIATGIDRDPRGTTRSEKRHVQALRPDRNNANN